MRALTCLTICACAVIVAAAPEYLRSYHRSYSSSEPGEIPKEYQNMDPEVRRAIEQTMQRSASGQYRSGGYHHSFAEADDGGQQTEDLGQQLEPSGYAIGGSGSRYTSNVHSGDEHDEDLGQQKEISGYNSGYSSRGTVGSGYSHVREQVSADSDSERGHTAFGSSGPVVRGSGYTSSVNAGDDDLGQQKEESGYGIGSGYGSRGTIGSGHSQVHESTGHRGNAAYGSTGYGSSRYGSGYRNIEHQETNSGSRTQTFGSGYSSQVHSSNENLNQQKEDLAQGSRGTGFVNSGAGNSEHVLNSHGSYGSVSGIHTEGNLDKLSSSHTADNDSGSRYASSHISSASSLEEGSSQHKELVSHSVNDGHVMKSEQNSATTGQGSVYGVNTIYSGSQNNRQIGSSGGLANMVSQAAQSENAFSSHSIMSHKTDESLEGDSQSKISLGVDTQDQQRQKPIFTGTNLGRPDVVSHEINTDDYATHESNEKLTGGHSLVLETNKHENSGINSNNKYINTDESHSTYGGQTHTIGDVNKDAKESGSNTYAGSESHDVTSSGGYSGIHNQYGMNYPHTVEHENHHHVGSNPMPNMGYPMHHTREYHMGQMPHTREYHIGQMHHTREYHDGQMHHTREYHMGSNHHMTAEELAYHRHNPHHMMHSHHVISGVNYHEDGSECHHDVSNTDDASESSTRIPTTVRPIVSTSTSLRPSDFDVRMMNNGVRNVQSGTNQGEVLVGIDQFVGTSQNDDYVDLGQQTQEQVLSNSNSMRQTNANIGRTTSSGTFFVQENSAQDISRINSQNDQLIALLEAARRNNAQTSTNQQRTDFVSSSGSSGQVRNDQNMLLIRDSVLQTTPKSTSQTVINSQSGQTSNFSISNQTVTEDSEELGQQVQNFVSLSDILNQNDNKPDTQQSSRDIVNSAGTTTSNGGQSLSVLGINNEDSNRVTETNSVNRGSTYGQMSSTSQVVGGYSRGDQPPRNVDDEDDRQITNPTFGDARSKLQPNKLFPLVHETTHSSSSYGSHASTSSLNHGAQQFEHGFEEDAEDLGQQQVVEPVFDPTGAHSGSLHTAEQVETQRVEEVQRKDFEKITSDDSYATKEHNEKSSVSTALEHETDSETLETAGTTTPKPGFWKRLGSKVTNIFSKTS